MKTFIYSLLSAFVLAKDLSLESANTETQFQITEQTEPNMLL